MPRKLAGDDHVAAVAQQQHQPENDAERELDPAVAHRRPAVLASDSVTMTEVVRQTSSASAQAGEIGRDSPPRRTGRPASGRLIGTTGRDARIFTIPGPTRSSFNGCAGHSRRHFLVQLIQGSQHNELYPLADSLPRLIGHPVFPTLMGIDWHLG